MEKWRLILDGPQSASFNMAADDFLLETVETGQSVPILRLYSWDKPSITIGYHQKLERAVDISRLNNTPVVRRITGGRAICHDDGELTYAVAGNFDKNPILGKSLSITYELIAQGIIRFYSCLDWEAKMASRDNPVRLQDRNFLQKGCYTAVSKYEITVNGCKVAAGSQRRSENSFMQHGAIRIAPMYMHPAILNSPAGSSKLLPDLSKSKNEYEPLLVKAFAEVFGVDFQPETYSRKDLTLIENRLHRFKNLATS